MKYIFLLLALFLPGLAYGQSYNALSYTAGSFYKGCGSSNAGVCSTDLNSLPVVFNGTMTYCADCNQDLVCSPGGSGAIAARVNNQWTCALGINAEIGNSGTFTNLSATHVTLGPGAVNITGGQGTNSTISGISSINGEVWANNFPGTDLGQQANNAIAALMPRGGILHIPAGQYQFSTTIQCPTTDAAIIIQGAGMTTMGNSNPNWRNQGTLLQYTGNGDAISQVLPAASQNFQGCQLRDLTMDGELAGPNSVGFHFGGTNYSGTDNVTIGYFPTCIELENVMPGPAGYPATWTERWHFSDTAIFRCGYGTTANGIGILYKSDWVGGTPETDWTSFSHGHMNVWFNIAGSGIGIKVTGSGNLYGSEVIMNGNTENNTSTAVEVTNQASFVQNWFVNDMECMQPTCYEWNVDATSMVGYDASGLQQGNWQSAVAPGGTLVYSAVSMGNPQYPQGLITSGTVYPQFSPQSQYAPNANPPWYFKGSINTANNTYSIANGACTRIGWNNSGLYTVSENTGNDKGLYLCGGNICTFIGSSQSTFGHVWTASSRTPPAGEASVAWNFSTGGYDICNNTGSTRTFAAMTLVTQSPGE